MQPPPQIQPPNVSGYANTPYSISSYSWYDGCLPEGYPGLFSSAHLPPRLSSKHNPPYCIVLYCIYKFIWRFLQCTPIRSASSARDPERRKQYTCIRVGVTTCVRVNLLMFYWISFPVVIEIMSVYWICMGNETIQPVLQPLVSKIK